jgi:hypothetical protein
LPDGTVGTEHGGIQRRNKDDCNQVVRLHGYPPDATFGEGRPRESLASSDPDTTHDRHGVGQSAGPAIDVDYDNRGLVEATARTPVGPAGRGRGVGAALSGVRPRR